VREPAAAIIPIVVGEPAAAVRLAARLLERGVLAPAIRPPSVPPGTARLRLTVMATHTDKHIERALEAFAAVQPQSRPPAGPPPTPAKGTVAPQARNGARAAWAAGDTFRAASDRPAAAGDLRIDPRILAAGGVFVTGTDTGVGKTVVAAAIARALRVGVRVAALKPVQTGTGEEADDLAFVASAGGVDPRLARAPYRLRAPLAPLVAAALEGTTVELERIHEAFRELRARADVVVVEGAGGLLVPVTDGLTMGGLAAGLGLPAVVVVRPGLGTVNHTCLTVAAARALGVAVCGLVICGFPSDPGLAEATNPAVLERTACVPLVGCLPVVEGLDVDTGSAGKGFDPLPWLCPSLGGRFDRAAFLESLPILVEEVTGVART
jgi:dethiobiotin synthetase